MEEKKGLDPSQERENPEEEIEKKKREEWLKKEKIRVMEQKKDYMNYLKGVMNKKGFNPKLKRNKFLGGVRGKG